MTLTIEPFKINDLLEVRLERGESVIYVDSAPFRICKYLFLIDPQNYPLQTTINSIDEAKEALNGNLEEGGITPETLGISKAEMFWGHCSNLQAWWKYDYDTRLLHSNLSFPLLKKLTEAGDAKAKRVFKEEVAKRFMDGYLPVIFYLLEEAYIDYLELEEREGIVEYLIGIYYKRIEHLVRHERALLLTELCVYCVDKRQIEKANKVIREIESIGKSKSLAMLWIRIGKRFLTMHEEKEAFKAFNRAHELDKSLGTAWYYRELCKKQKALSLTKQISKNFSLYFRKMFGKS